MWQFRHIPPDGHNDSQHSSAYQCVHKYNQKGHKIQFPGMIQCKHPHIAVKERHFHRNHSDIQIQPVKENASNAKHCFNKERMGNYIQSEGAVMLIPRNIFTNSTANCKWRITNRIKIEGQQNVNLFPWYKRAFVIELLNRILQPHDKKIYPITELFHFRKLCLYVKMIFHAFTK